MSHRRRLSVPLSALVAALLVAAGLSGCSSGSGAPAQRSGSSHRTVVDAKGRTVSVPAHPQRVLALSEPTLDAAVTLGVHVVGATSGRGQGGLSAYLASKAKGVPIVASVAGPNFELITTKRPDLILVDGTVTMDDQSIQKLSQIAPTAFVSKTGENWQQAFRAAGRVLNRSAQAATFLTKFAGRVSAVRGKLGKNADATISIVRWGDSMPSVLLKEIAASTVVTALGLRRPPSQNRVGKGHSQPISLENLDQLDADWMFFGTLGGATNPAGGNKGASADVVASRAALRRAAADTPGFARLRAYQLGHVVPVDGSAWMSAGGPQAELTVLQSIADALTAS